MSDWTLKLNAVAAGVVVTFGFTMVWNPIPVSWAGLAGLGFTALLVWLGTTPKHIWAWACLFLGLESLSWPAVQMIKLQMSGVVEPSEDQMKGGVRSRLLTASFAGSSAASRPRRPRPKADAFERLTVAVF